MTKRPVVIIVGHMSPPGIDVNDVDSERDAFTAFVRDSYGCQSLVFDHLVFLQEKLEDVKKLVGDDDAALFVVTQSRYDDDHNKLVAVVRESISETIPISVIKGYPDYEYPIAEFNDPNVNVTSSSDGAIDALAAIIDSRRTRDSKKDYFGLTDPREVRSLSSRLASVHATESAESELAAMGENDRVLFQALRLRLLPPTELKAGFDDVVRQIEPENEPLPTVRSPVYEAEVERIRSMDDAARDAFYDVLLAATGCIRAPGGGIFKREIGRGQNNFGFAIDAVSFEEAITKGFGSHNMAAFFLE
ncbi:MAG: hypothetical protein KGH68_02575, partial [Patescibacteria group bacterium]|nr:hypothetical protein [Patescibacteria group bacterium]